MNVGQDIDIFYFDSRKFSMDGRGYEIVGCEKRQGKTIDTVKSKSTGKMKEFEREKLAEMIMKRQDSKPGKPRSKRPPDSYQMEIKD